MALRAELEAMNAGMLASIMGYYGFPADLVQECPEKFVEIPLTQRPAPEGDKCKEILAT